MRHPTTGKILLFDQLEDRTDSYEVIPASEHGVEDIRAKLIEDSELHTFKSTSETITNRFKKGDELDWGFVDNDSKDYYSKIISQAREGDIEYQEKLETLKQKYIAGEYSGRIPTCIFESDGGTDCFIRGYLWTGDERKITLKDGRKLNILENILKIDRQTYASELLLSGQDDLFLIWGEYSPLLSFNAKKIDEFTQKDINRMENNGMLSKYWKEKHSSSAKVLKLMRERGRVI